VAGWPSARRAHDRATPSLSVKCVGESRENLAGLHAFGRIRGRSVMPFQFFR
jgi:hypothetical protein